MNDCAHVINVKNLVVVYGRGAKQIKALNGISFQVNKGECVGFIGANGAGKTTTMKVLMGFLFPRDGEVKVFGENAGTVESRRRIGYLPEVSLYYPFMKARELLELYGGLHGLSRKSLKKKIPELLDKVGLDGKAEILLKNFSKGMQQRLGIAQAIIADPEALIFDELSSGLDPMGRFDLRDVLLDLKKKGRTIFFSSHELTEVETLCDRVIIIHKGEIATEATIQDLMKPLNIFEILFSYPENKILPEEIRPFNPSLNGNTYCVNIDNVADYSRAISILSSSGAAIIKTSSKSRSLEEYFIQLISDKGGGKN
jgi:ABC-2 type transport system ATP-binding protein